MAVAVGSRAARLAAAAACLALAPAGAAAQQVPDREYRPPVVSPAYAAGSGPVVCIDEAHRNFHTMDDRFWAFAELLRRDGYRVQAQASVFRAAVLRA